MLNQVQEKIYNGQRLTREEGLYLYNHVDLATLGQLATYVRLKKAPENHKKSVWWNTNIHLNPTNICIASCNFCAFAKKPKDPDAYTLTIEQAVQKAVRGYQNGATEVHIVGGLNPKTLLPYYTDLLCSIKQTTPDLHIKAFTAVEVAFFAKFSKLSYREVLQELVNAGLDSMPGGGAEVFAKSVRDFTCPDKIPAQTWLEIHGIAHELGLRSNATMLAGIGESIEDRIDHMIALREQQDVSRGFQTFIPLSCHYDDTDIQDQVQPITGIEQLKNIALGRLMLDNFAHIKAYWVQLGHSIAQVALHFGADDMDGTVTDEKITYAAGSQHNQTAKEFLQKLISGTGFVPVERDTLYHVI